MNSELFSQAHDAVELKNKGFDGLGSVVHVGKIVHAVHIVNNASGLVNVQSVH